MKLNLKHTARHAGKVIQQGSPTILTALGVAGVVATGYLAAKASFKAGDALAEARIDKAAGNIGTDTQYIDLTTQEKALKIWKLYIPAVASGSLSIGCIIAANRIQARRMAALVAAYAVISGDFDEYREKASELLGGKKFSELKESSSKKNVEEAMASTRGVLVPDGKSWFIDMATKRPILTTREVIESAKNEMNFTILNVDGGGDASLNDFYAQIGLDPAESIGDLLGWNKNHKCQIEFTPMLLDGYGAVTAFHFKHGPVPHYWKSQLTQKEFDELSEASDD